MTDITITDSAQTYLNGLLEKQSVDGMGVRLFVSQPGTMYAETCLAYCRPGEEKPEDERVACDGFTAYLDQPSLPYLDEAVVDYVADKLGGQLTIKAPKAKQPAVAFDGPIEQQIVESKKNERANALKELKRLYKEFGFTADMLKGALAEGRKKS